MASGYGSLKRSRLSYIPDPGDRKSGIPLGTLNPAPAMTTIFEGPSEMLSAIFSMSVHTNRSCEKQLIFVAILYRDKSN
jgi:hypothetical protein